MAIWWIMEKSPKCEKIENQIKAGYNGLGSQRCKCKECGIYYTIELKRHAYTEETRKLVIKMYYAGVSGRMVGESSLKVCQKRLPMAIFFDRF